MNRSIAKTRNQLERITYKINQLKTKYTGQGPMQQSQENFNQAEGEMRRERKDRERGDRGEKGRGERDMKGMEYEGSIDGSKVQLFNISNFAINSQCNPNNQHSLNASGNQSSNISMTNSKNNSNSKRMRQISSNLHNRQSLPVNTAIAGSGSSASNQSHSQNLNPSLSSNSNMAIVSNPNYLNQNYQNVPVSMKQNMNMNMNNMNMNMKQMEQIFTLNSNYMQNAQNQQNYGQKQNKSDTASYIDKCFLLNQTNPVRQAYNKSNNGNGASCSPSSQPCSYPQNLQENQSESQMNYQLNLRVNKLQQDSTSFLTSLHEIISICKKNQKNMNQKLINLQLKLRKQINDVRQCVRDQENNNQILFQRVLRNMETSIENRIGEILGKDTEEKQGEREQWEKYIEKQLQDIRGKADQVGQIEDGQKRLVKRYQVLEKDIAKLKQRVTKQQKREKENKINDNVVEGMVVQKVQQIFENEVKGLFSNLRETLQKNCSDIAGVAESLLKIEDRLQQKQTKQIIVESPNIQPLTKRVDSIQSRIKSIQKCQQSLSQSQKCQLLSSLTPTIQSSVSTSISSSLSSSLYSSLQSSLSSSLSSSLPQLQSQIQSQYLKPRLEQSKRQLLTKLSQELEFNKNQLFIKMEEILYEKVGRIVGQEIEFQRVRRRDGRETPKCQIEESRTSKLQIKQQIKQQVRQLESRLKNLIYQQIQQKLQKLGPKLNPNPNYNMISSSIIHNSRQSPKPSTPIHSHTHSNPTEPEQKLDSSQLIMMPSIPSSNLGSGNGNGNYKIYQKIQEKVDEKLDQFQLEINQTIKLLYEDIQVKVNQLLNGGLGGIVDEIRHIKGEIGGIITRIEATERDRQKEREKENLENFATFAQEKKDNIKEQEYSDLGSQIDKLSNILYQAVEQIETKIEKLDQNFSYIYQRTSKIQFDNANFNDKLIFLSSLISQQKPIKTQPSLLQQSPNINMPSNSNININPSLNESSLQHEIELQSGNELKELKKSNSNSGLLTALGSYNAGGYFLEVQ